MSDTEITEEEFLDYKKSAELGDLNAMINLAECYADGEVTEKNLKEAFIWYKKSAELGNSKAMRAIANYYWDGVGTEKDDKEAFIWYKKSVELGNSEAINDLADCYRYGAGTEKDEKEAFNWYKKSAELGDSNAMNTLFKLKVNTSGENRYNAELEMYDLYINVKKKHENIRLFGDMKKSVMYLRKIFELEEQNEKLKERNKVLKLINKIGKDHIIRVILTESLEYV